MEQQHLKKPRKSKFTRLSYLQRYCTALSHGPRIVDTFNSSTTSISDVSASSSRSMGSEYVTNVEVLEQAETTSIESMLLKVQLHWAGHVSRMEDHRLPKITLFGELSVGHRDRGAPKKRFKDSLKKTQFL